MTDDTGMESYWDAAATEDAYFYVDNRLVFGEPDADRFWAEGEKDFDTLMDLSEARLKPPDDVVEIGCGLGRLTRVIASRAATVRALDISGEMLRQARALNPAVDNVTWVHGDGTSLAGIEDASADACISHVVFQHIPDPAITLGYVTEMARVLRPGGWSAFQVSTDPDLHKRTFGQKLRGRLQALRPGSPPGMVDKNWLGAGVPLDQLRHAAEAAGLKVATVTGENSQYTVVRLVREG